jgi:hypothetical protein
VGILKLKLFIHTYTYHSRFIPERVAEVFKLFF